jgi:MFS family permease
MDKKVRRVKTVALITAACLLGDSMLYVVLPTHWEEFGLTSLWQVGILLSVNRFVRLPLSPFVGWLYQSMSKRAGILLAVALAVITTAGYGLVKGLWPLLLLRCLWGMAWTFLRLGAYFTIMDLSENSNRGYYLGTYNGLFRLGSLAGMLAGGVLADSWGIAPVCALFASIALVALPYVWRDVEAERTVAVQAASGDSGFSWFRQREIGRTLLSGLFIALLFQGVFAAVLSHVIELRQTDVYQIGGFLVGAASIGGLLQAIRWGWEPFLAPWFGKVTDGERGRRPLFVLCLALAAMLFALVPADMPFLLWIALFLFIQLTATALTTVMDALASDAASRSDKVTVMTAYSMVTDLGAALGPSLAYLVGSLWGMAAVFWGAAGICLLLGMRWAFASFSLRRSFPQ